MKKILLSLFSVAALSATAQDVATYGLLANPWNLYQNPGADPVTKFHMGFMNLRMDFGANTTAGQLFGTPDLLANLSSLTTDATSLNGEINLDLINVGAKIGKNYLFFGTANTIQFGGQVDNDLFRFAKYGMADASGNFDPNYSGDFASTSIHMDIVTSTYLGFQRSFMDEKLRVGLMVNNVGYAGGARVLANSFNASSSPNTATGMNTLSLDYDLDILTYGLIDPNAVVDSLSDLGSNVLAIDPNNPSSIQTGSDFTATTFGFGITYRPIEKLELQYSMNGLGASSLEITPDRGFNLGSTATIGGFSYTSSAGDSVAASISEATGNYVDEISDALNSELQSVNTPYSYSMPMTMNFAANYYLKNRSFVGAHYTSRSNSNRDFSYLGFNGMVWLTKGLQLKGGYYMALDDMNFDMINAAIQFRLTPLVQMYVASNTISPAATYISENSSSGFTTNRMGASTNSLNFQFGVTVASLYDSRFKEEKEARREAKAKNSQTNMTPATQAAQ